MAVRKTTKLMCDTLPVTAGAVAAGLLSSPIIDAVQPTIVEYISVGAGTAFVAAATYLTQKFGIKVFEYFNRQAIESAAATFATSVIDMLQERYARTPNPDVSDIVSNGVRYIKTGNPDAVRQSNISDDRLAVKVKAALNARTSEEIVKTLAAKVAEEKLTRAE